MITLQSTNSPSFKSTLNEVYPANRVSFDLPSRVNEVRCRFRTHKPVHPLPATLYWQDRSCCIDMKHTTTQPRIFLKSTSRSLRLRSDSNGRISERWKIRALIYVLFTRNHVHCTKIQTVENSSSWMPCEHSINGISGSFSSKNLT